MAVLTKIAWKNKIWLCQTDVLSTRLYGCESRIAYMHQERRPNTFHRQCLKRIRAMSWQDRVP